MLNKKALQLGLVLGGLSILIYLLIYFMGVEAMSTWWVFVTAWLVVLAVKIFFSLRLKKTPGVERISYWQAFFAVIIIFVVSGILTFGYERTVNYLDPHLMENIQNASIVKTIAMMEGFGAPQEKIDQTIDDMMERFEDAKNVTFTGMVKDMSLALALYAAIAFIMAIFVRKSPSLFPESSSQQPVNEQ